MNGRTTEMLLLADSYIRIIERVNGINDGQLDFDFLPLTKEEANKSIEKLITSSVHQRPDWDLDEE